MDNKLINADMKVAIVSQTPLRELIMNIIVFWDVRLASQLRNLRSHCPYKLKIS
jgi:hypothetical protein